MNLMILSAPFEIDVYVHKTGIIHPGREKSINQSSECGFCSQWDSVWF